MSNHGRQITFRQLLSDCHGIRIPMIQRDYAQGRDTEAHIRNEFLSTIENALTKASNTQSPPLNLDFVYGSIEGSTKTWFAPLDGQQRLTTLFLLHWYLAWRDERWNDFERMLVKEGKSTFTYRVRSSSTEFFDFLVAFYPEVQPDDVELLSAIVRDQPGYFRSWRLDPTIQSTLVMLDAIHDRFVNKSGLFDRLWDQEQPAITFQLLDLNNFGLSDDLYIKMNARGVPLTPFETFKAYYEQALENQFPGVTRRISGQDFSIRDFVARRFDNTWMDLFWAEAEGSKSGTSDVHRNIFNFLCVMALITRHPDAVDCLRDIVLLTRTRPVYSIFRTHGWLDETFTDTLIPVLETWCVGGGGLQALLPNQDYFDEKKSLFEDDRGFRKLRDSRSAAIHGLRFVYS